MVRRARYLSMRIAIHQPNFIPWFPFFEKMEKCDKFVILGHCQFEKNGFQNRAKVCGKWWTNPVKHGLINIIDKEYSDGTPLMPLNMSWIKVIAKTLGIDTSKIVYDFPTMKKGTARILEICHHYKADEYLAHEDAPAKYLDIKVLEKYGIKFIPFKSKYETHVFEVFHHMGIDGARKLLKNGDK